MDKIAARSLALEMRKGFDVDLASIKAIDEIINLNILFKYSNVGIYYPIGKEINILKLMDIYPNKNFYLPITRDEISFIRYKKNDKLVKGSFKTMEPIGDIISRNQIEVFIIPCVAVGKDNRRIGYGKGYYDRYLENYNGLKIGICYEKLSNLDVDCDLFDIKLDYVIKGWLYV